MDNFPLSRDFFINNRRRLSEQLPKDAVAVVSAHSRLQRSGDVHYRFRQNSNFYYLTGLNTPDCMLVLAPGHKRKEYRQILVIADNSRDRTLWEGSESVGQLRSVSGIANIMERRQLERVFGSIIKEAASIYLPRSNNDYMSGVAQNAALGKTESWLRKKVGRKKLRDISPLLNEMRMVKQPPEIECIKRAIAITKNGLAKARRALRTAEYEYQVVAAIRSQFLLSHSREAFPSIVAAAGNGCTIHYQKDTGPIRKGQLVLIDVGAEYGLYAADVSRTLATGGRLAKRQRQVYEAVAATKRYAESQLGPGVILANYERSVREFMKRQLIKLGLIKASSPTKSAAKYFPHATSHFLGLDVHDVGDYSRELEPGMVLTVEPGIYIPEEALAVRLEDDLLITERGSQNLSASIPY